MTYVMEAVAQYSKLLVILDRPNPISGNLQLAEGPMLDMATASFLGRWSLPLRHSCTLGELARYFNTMKNIKARLEVIPCSEWDRNMFQPDWHLPFVPTSPAIQSFESMLLYPGDVTMYKLSTKSLIIFSSDGDCQHEYKFGEVNGLASLV
ncbi:unnamed protein product [Rotaria sp. Silwood1]|nr:unnamed protein product [Rotaria sp. Silwood1]